MKRVRKELRLIRATFLTGLAVVLPVVISVAVVIWLFGTVSNFTDKLLFFFPREWIYRIAANGELILRWYSSYLAFAVALFAILLVGRLTRIYLGRQLIKFVDTVILQVPLLNRVYALIKQVNEAFASNSKSNFKQVVLVEYPVKDHFSLGFLTAEQKGPLGAALGPDTVSVFVPTTPNPTTGFLLLLPADKVRRAKLTVAEGIKIIISLGTVAPGMATTSGNNGATAVLSGEVAEQLEAEDA